MQKLKRLAGETMLYGLGNMVPRLLNFVLFPFHTEIFAPGEYGVFTKLMSVVAILNIVYSFGMETAYFRFATKPDADEKKIFNLAQTVVTLISTVLTATFILGSSSFTSLLGLSQSEEKYVVWLAAIMFIDNIVAIPFARLRLEKKAIQFAIYRLANVIILTALNLYFLYVIYDPAIGIGYVFIANLIANAFYLVFFFRTFISWRPVFDKVISFTMAQYAFPIMLTGLAGMTNEFFSRLTLEKWLPPNFYPGRSAEFALGVFGGCYKFSVFMNLTVQAFRMAAEPFFFSQAQDKKSPELFAKVNHYFIVVASFIMLAVSINMDILKQLFLRQDEYWEGISIVPPLLLGYLFLGIYYNFSVWFKLTDKTYYGTIIAIGGALLTFVLNYFLIPIAGYDGSSWATAIVYGAMALVCYLLGQRNMPIPYHVAVDLTYLVVTYLLIYAVQLLMFTNQWVATGVHTLILILYGAMIYIIEKRSWNQSLR